MTNEPQEQDDELDGFDSTAGVMAFVYAKEGAEGLKALLATVGADQETLERDAQELMGVGLPAVAAIVAAYAEQAPSGRELFCPYAEDDINNYKCWQKAYVRRQLCPGAF